MKTPRRLTALLLLGLAGFAVELVQTHHFFDVRNGPTSFTSLCTVGSLDCDAIDSSPYAELLPGLPLSAFAAGWLLAIAIIAFLARESAWRRPALLAIAGMSAFGTVFSTIYLYIMLAVIRALCPFCLIVDAINISVLAIALSFRPWKMKRPEGSREKAKTLVWVTLGSLAAALFLGKTMDAPGMSSSEIDLLAERVVSNTAPVRVSAPGAVAAVGAPDAPITIVKFSDFQCPACRRGALSIHHVLKRYEGKVRFEFRAFPLDMRCNRKVTSSLHPAACDAARAAVCADRQGKFETLYRGLFDGQDLLKSRPVAEYAAAAGLDMAQYEACMADPSSIDAVSKDVEEGIRLGVESTPTFFINGRRVPGAYPPEIWYRIVDRLLAAGDAVAAH